MCGDCKAAKGIPTKGIGKKYKKSISDFNCLGITVEFKHDYVLGFIICEIFTVIALRDWAGWGVFALIPGYPWRANGQSQHLEACPELQDWLQFQIFTVKSYRTGPFSK